MPLQPLTALLTLPTLLHFQSDPGSNCPTYYVTVGKFLTSWGLGVLICKMVMTETVHTKGHRGLLLLWLFYVSFFLSHWVR